MKELDEVQIYCPQQPHNFAKSVSFPINIKETDPNKQSPASEDQIEQHKSGQLKPMLNQKPIKSRKKVSILKAPKQSFHKHPEHRSSEFTKRKPSAKKKMSSVSEDKGPTIDYSEQVIQLLKKQLREKEKEVKFYRTHLEKLQEITDSINNKELRRTYSFESTLSFLRSKIQTEICKAFPVVARMIDSMLTVLEQSVVHSNSTMLATQKHSTWTNLYTQSPSLFDPAAFIMKDIEGLQQKLKSLKEQSMRLKMNNSKADEISQLKKLAQQQQEEILQLIQMEQIMENSEKQFKKKGAIGHALKLNK